MTLAHLLVWIVQLFDLHGAHHVARGVVGPNGWAASHNYLVGVCKIPAHLHGTFTCTARVTRP